MWVRCPMKQIIYRSQPFGFDQSMLAGILMQARRNNPREDITGALICRHDIYLQLLEGPAGAIDALYAKIEADDRHANVRLLHSGEAEDRMFPDWSMLDDEMPTLTWSPAEIADGAIDNAKPKALLAVFERVAEKARQTG